MTLIEIAAPTFIPALVIAFGASRSKLLTALIVLNLVGIAAVVLFSTTQVFDCGGEICLSNAIAAMFAAAATIVGDIVLLIRWFLARRRPEEEPEA